MSAKRNLADDKHSITSNLMDITKHFTIKANESIATSYETVATLVQELVETATNIYTEENRLSNTFIECQAPLDLKDESVLPNLTNGEELPVRRSSRIQRLSTQGDLKKKDNQKESKQNKNSKVSLNSDKELLKISDVVEGEHLIIPDGSPENTITVASSDIDSESQETDNCNKYNSETSKKASKRIQKKENKELDKETQKQDVEKAENQHFKEELKVNENNKKRPYIRKKKPNLVDLDRSINEVINDVIKSSLVDDIPDDASLSIESDSSLHNEVQLSEGSQDHAKTYDTENPDCQNKAALGSDLKHVKVKSLWLRSSELEGAMNAERNSTEELVSLSENNIEINELLSPPATSIPEKMEIYSQAHEVNKNIDVKDEAKDVKESPVYVHIDDNIYRFTRKKSKSKKQVRRMVCDCTLTKEEQECGILGCKEECLNRLLMIECGYRCPLGEACSNKKFEKKQYVKYEVFKADKKGWGLKAMEDISRDDFVLEFVGEVLNHKEYRQRVKQYAKEKVVHSYFMALKTDEILDATIMGNCSRFINHSCDPNCETQKWTVNGELRVGVFAKRTIPCGEEFTLDYKFQRYGREAQKCLCGSDNCSGFIGGAKQISIDAYSVSKSCTTKKKKGSDDKKRDLDDIALEEEIEKLNSSKGLRNKEETLKLARLMVRAEESLTRHQLLDIIIKTEEQACLRLFLDYHGLPLMWSWMTDVVDFDLKAKILQVLALLPISNKTMLFDSKVMSVVEKWVQECNTDKKDESVNEKITDSALTSPVEDTSEPAIKKLKIIEFSDSETDSTGSHNANDNSSETSSITDHFKIETATSSDVPTTRETTSEPSIEDNKSVVENDCIKQLEDPDIQIKTNISNIGSVLLNSWKNLKEVFRIPRLEQQKRKEDEMEADYGVLRKTEKKPEVEVTGDHIQVLVTTFTPRFSDDRIYDNDNPEVDFKTSDHSNNNLLSVLTSNKRFNKVTTSKESAQRKPIQEESKPLLETEPSSRPSLLPTPTFINQVPVNFPLPLNPGVVPPVLLKQPPPQSMFPPPQIVYPQSQVSFVNTAALPPILSHPPSSMPPAQILPQPSSLLQPPPGTNYPPPSTSIPPPTTNLPPPGSNLPLQTHTNLPPPVNNLLPSNPASFQLPPVSAGSSNMPPTSHFIQNPPPTGFLPPTQNPYGNQNQQFYYVQRHPQPVISTSSSLATFSENVCAQTSSSLPLPTVNTVPSQTMSYPSNSLQPVTSISMSSSSVPVQHMQPLISQAIPSSSRFPVEQLPIQPVVKEEPKPVKLPKNWRSATDDEGCVYYYHSVTRETQWDPPTLDQISDDSEEEEEDSESEESESSDTPTYDEPKVFTKHSKRKSKKKKTTTAAADTSVSFPVRPEVAKKIKELFRTKMSSYIIHCLNGYRKPDCTVGRITNNDDFKYLARKLTHYTMTKELKQCKNVEDLDCNEQVMHKAKDYLKKYMAKYGSTFVRKDKFSPET